MRLREIAIGAALGGLLAAVVALTLPEPAPVPAGAPAPAAAVPPVAAPAPRASVPMPPAAAQAAEARWRGMQAGFERARNLREFFHALMRKPDNDAIYYAMQVLSVCGRVLEQDPAALPPARRQAALELERRCDFTREGLQDARRELRASRHPDPGTDAVMRSLSAYLAADGAEGRAALLGAAFKQGDPAIISLLTTAAVVRNMPASPADDPDATRAVPFGAALVDCRLGAECGPGAIRTIELCMRYGWCADSVPAALQQGLGAQFALLDTVASQIANELRRRGR